MGSSNNISHQAFARSIERPILAEGAIGGPSRSSKGKAEAKKPGPSARLEFITSVGSATVDKESRRVIRAQARRSFIGAQKTTTGISKGGTQLLADRVHDRTQASFSRKDGSSRFKLSWWTRKSGKKKQTFHNAKEVSAAKANRLGALLPVEHSQGLGVPVELGCINVLPIPLTPQTQMLLDWCK
jgi:hypothetical protein